MFCLLFLRCAVRSSRSTSTRIWGFTFLVVVFVIIVRFVVWLSSRVASLFLFDFILFRRRSCPGFTLSILFGLWRLTLWRFVIVVIVLFLLGLFPLWRCGSLVFCLFLLLFGFFLVFSFSLFLFLLLSCQTSTVSNNTRRCGFVDSCCRA